MTIQRTESEIIIKIPATTGTEEIQWLIDYLIYTNAVSGSKAKQDEVDKLAREVNKDWWAENKNKFIKN